MYARDVETTSSTAVQVESLDYPEGGTEYLDAAANRLLIFDGATGTNLQLLGLTPEDFGGRDLDGCNEMLCLSKPEVIHDLHERFFAAGSRVVETDTFGANEIVLSEYGISGRARDINLAAARIARSAADAATARERASTHGRFPARRFVAGSMGPGTKSPSLGQTTYAILRCMYQAQAEALIEGGVDVLLVETIFDILQAKAAIEGTRRAMLALGLRLPIQVQVTIESTGRMLAGTEISAALTSLSALTPDIIGMNCATGPQEMGEHVRYLSRYSRYPISVQPNAGLPSVVDGRMHYDLTPEDLASHLHRFVTEYGVSIVGGCCGTTPEHIEAVVARLADVHPASRSPQPEPGISSLFAHVPYRQETSFLVIGERANANGSKRFRDAVLAADHDLAASIAREQERGGAHVLDVCVDYTGRDGTADIQAVVSRLASRATAPLMIDTTEANVAKTALELLGSKPILNSVNLEDGDARGTRLDLFLSLARDYGAAVVATCIDSEGQARNAAWKLRAARSISSLATGRYGLDPHDVLVDPLVLPITTGMEESRRDGLETIEAIRLIKEALPDASTVIGLSNISFGLTPGVRPILNSVFLHECIEAGLDAAILHAGNISPLSRIPEEAVTAALDLVYDRRRPGYDPLEALMLLDPGSVPSPAEQAEDRSSWPVERRLSQRIVDGDRNGIEGDLDAAMDGGFDPLAIINDHLLAGMKVVGELFGSGRMQLPYVLQSAETMKAAVAYLETRMDRDAGSQRGTIVLATVKGDVHDIGKNLVDIIMTNNGYKVVNLGTKVGLSQMLDAFEEHGADAIGMSGLLVKSTIVMRDSLVELNERSLAAIPVILGGAALTRGYVERDLREVYEGRVFYGKDAFEGLSVMDRLMSLKRSEVDDPAFGREQSAARSSSRRRLAPGGEDPALAASGGNTGTAATLPSRSPEVISTNPVFPPPFTGSRIAKGIPLDEIVPYLNKTALYRNQWGFRPDKESAETDSRFKERIDHVLRSELTLAREKDLLVPQVAWGYFPAASEADDVVIYSDDKRREERQRFRFPRQQEPPYLCIADFFRPVDCGETDWAAFQLVTMGNQVTLEAGRLFEANEYGAYVRLHGLGVELTEALAEYWHKRIRQEWGFGVEDGGSVADLFRQRHRGGRYSWGYPACPDLTDNEKAYNLLEGARIGVELTETFQFVPEQSTIAIICHHPQAKYFVA